MQAGCPLTRCLLLEDMMANLSPVLARAAADHGGRPAVRLDDLVLSYSQLQDAAARVASLLSALGVTPGDRIGVMLPNVPAFPIAFYGALAAGAVVVPMNPLLKSREVAHYVGDSGAKVLFAWHQAAVEAAKGAAGTGAQVLEVDEPDLHTMLAGLPPAPSSGGYTKNVTQAPAVQAEMQ
jgi:long-chain acyl-CoA synthetase